MTLRQWIVPLCTGIAGLAAGLLLGGHLERADGAAVAAPAAPAGISASRERPAPPADISLEAIRRVVREELDARAAAGGARETPTVAGPPEDSPPSREQAASAAQAHTLLDAAIARRQWTDDDARSLRAHFHELTSNQQSELLQRFTVAVNQGRLVPETDQVPF
jgi:hypothetical protein